MTPVEVQTARATAGRVLHHLRSRAYHQASAGDGGFGGPTAAEVGLVPRTQDLLRGYFRSKSDQLRAAAQASVGDHAGLRGGHREAVVRIYLNSILP
jgi:hypothetical protein